MKHHKYIKTHKTPHNPTINHKTIAHTKGYKITKPPYKLHPNTTTRNKY